MAGLGLIFAIGFFAPQWAGVVSSRAGFPALTLRAAWAQDFALAGQHFASAQDAFAQGKFEQAAKEFQAAYDITHDPSMLVNIGESWQRAGDGKKALAGYRGYLAAQPQAPDRSEIEGRIQAIEAALSDTAGATGQPGAASPPVPTSPAAPANPANPAATANPAGVPTGAEKSPPTATLPTNQAGPAPTIPPAVGPGLGLDKPRLPPPTEPGKTEPAGPTKSVVTPPPRPPSHLRTAAWVTVAVAVALATSGAIVGLGAQDRADELLRRTTTLVGSQPPVYDAGQAEAYTSLQSEGKAYNQAGITLLCAAGAVAVTAGVLFIVDYVRRPKPETRARGSWALLPTLLPGGAAAQAMPSTGGLVASGSF